MSKSYSILKYARISTKNVQEILKYFSLDFSNFESFDRSKLERFSDFIEKGFANELINVHPSVVINLFQKFKELLPKEKKP